MALHFPEDHWAIIAALQDAAEELVANHFEGERVNRMFFPTGKPKQMLCSECGIHVYSDSLGDHTCSEERVIRHQVNRFQDEFSDWLQTPHGRFAQYVVGRS